MNFFKKLFEFLFHKDHIISKKVYTFGAVVVTTCIVSAMILGANGYASSMYNDTAEKEQEIIANEEDMKELEVIETEEEDLVSQDELLSNYDYRRYESHCWKAFVDSMVSFSNSQVDKKALAIGQDKNLSLSTAGRDSEDGYVTISSQDVDVIPNRDPIKVSNSDYQVLLTIVEAEVGTEDLNTRMMIANTIINRMLHDYYPDTIEEVVFQNDGKVYQFSPIQDGRYWEVTASKKTIEAVDNALAGYDNSQGALAFVNRDITNPDIMKWFDDNLIFVAKYGKVEYFRF